MAINRCSASFTASAGTPRAIITSGWLSFTAARQALRQLGLRGREDLPARVLSAGQKRRVALTRLLLEKRKLWVLDEPLTALDKAAVANLCGMIDAHLAAGGMAVLTSHQDLPMAGRVEHLRLD